jgi:UDP-N-acetyl-D-galactosamine dehydrogenase
MYNQLISKKIKLAVIGLGYVGLPLALEFAKHFSVIGYDINQRNLKLLQSKIDPSKEIPQESFHNRDIHFTSNSEELRDASFFVIAVPTPIDKYNKPDLRPLLSATLTVANIIQPGDYVIYESTVYPGCTYEECVPLLERVSGLRVRRDFKVGYSPERINPGDAEHSLQNTIKIVSACDSESLETTAKVYESVVTAGVHRAPDIRVAEAAKIIENTQRDVNIALMNELSILFNRMGINTYDVIQAAATKWNFVPYTPGLVGGHCIGVDPYYMVHKASELKYHPQILILGVTYKENVSDIRNSKVVDIVRELQSFRVAVDVVDPHADPHAVEEEYQIKMLPKPGGKYHAVIVAVAHKDYVKMTENDFKELLDPKGLVVDLRGVFKETIKELRYWSL